MVRNLFILALLVAVIAIASPAAAVTLKIATLAPEGSGWMTDMRAAADEIATKTAGRVKFKFYGGGVMGNESIVLKKIRVGQLQGGAFTSGGLAEVYPDIQLYTLPLLFKSSADADRVRAAFDAELGKGLEDAGFVNFGFAEGGFALMMGEERRPTAASLKGEKVWVPEGDRITYEMMHALGLSPVTLPIADVMTGLQTGLIDVIGSSAIGAIAFQWHTRVKAVCETPLVYVHATLGIDKKAFAKIDPADQVIVREVLERLYRDLDRKNRADDQAALAALRTQGLDFYRLSDEEEARWRAIGRDLALRLGNEGVFTMERYQRLLKVLEGPAQ